MGESALTHSGKPQPVPLTLQAYIHLLARYLRPQIPQVVLMTIFLLLGIAVKLVNPQMLRYFLDTAQAGGGSSALMGAAALFIAFAILQQGMSLATHYTAKAVGWTATNRLRADLTRHLLRLDLSFHKSRTPGELIDRVDGDVTQLANFFSMFSVNILGDGLLVLGILILLFREDPGVGVGMLGYIALTLFVLRYIQGLAVPRRAAERQAGAMLYGYIEERISGAEEIRAAGAESYAMRRLHDLMRTYTEKTRIALVISSLTYNLTNLVYVIGYAAGLALGVYLYSQGQASLGTVYLITYYIGMLSDPLQSIRAQVQDLQQASANIQRIQELFEIQPRVAAPLQGAQALPGGALGVEFTGVSFRYRDQEPNPPAPFPERKGEQNLSPALPSGSAKRGEGSGVPISAANAAEIGTPSPNSSPFLSGKGAGGLGSSPHTLSAISFSIQPGRVLGILGRTGSGKSTLTRLLFRLYDPERGAIRLNGIDLRTVPLADLRRQVGMVTQDVQLFQASVRENLTFFNDCISDVRIQSVLESLQLWDWVQSLPQGLATPLAGGQSLSAGEAQLLAFARVFLKDPGLVVLDEASSRLDPSTEALMEQASDHLFAGRTGVVIAHRLKTVQRADDILILEEGRVVEFGARLALANDLSSRFYQLLRVGMEEALV